ncbi:hypothetical protein JW948_10030 [bacterium]|nr:hypothetical protein [bacterium]
MKNSTLHIGVDLGSVSIKMAVLNHEGTELSALGFVHFESPAGKFWLSPYIRHQGSAFQHFQELYENVRRALPDRLNLSLWTTGRTGKVLSGQLNIPHIQEFQAAAEGVARLFPDVGTIFEMGGESAKFLEIHRGNGRVQITDYEMNGDCAAGTGLFFDQQAGRLKFPVEKVGDVVGDACRSACIAGRCSVFAKSDMIHAQQRGYKPEEILKGLCDAVIRNFRGSVTKGKRIREKAAFIGGMAANAGVVNAVRPVFGFTDGELVVPEYPAWVAAMGAALAGIGSGSASIAVPDFQRSGIREISYPTTAPLSMDNVILLRNETDAFRMPETGIVDAYLGIDIGSVSTNLALITPDGDLIHGIYRMTEGRPIEVVRAALEEMHEKAGDRIRILGAGTTGSGRELIGLLTGADVIKDEITAHKTGAIHVSRRYLGRTVDTIFEIGGQDSKFISLNDGIVVDFALNEACAAGTGSFLEEQASQIGIQIKEEFARLALESQTPLQLGERCTVFMEKELIPWLRRNVPKKDIVAGLALSVVQNYLNRVVKKRPVGDLVFFQGGTAYNDAVAAAFSTVLGREIVVPPHNGIMGAIGAALLARNAADGPSRFRGWDLSKVHWDLREFTCRACTNQCTIQEFSIEGEKSYWGDKCSDRYRKRSKSRHTAVIPDLFAWRDKLTFSAESNAVKSGSGMVAMPRVLYLFDRFPFWRTYFEALGFHVTLSESTHQDTVNRGLEATVAEPCFPVQVTHGHIARLLESPADFIFLPNMVNESAPPDTPASFYCPWAQTAGLMAAHSPVLESMKERLLFPNVQFRMDPALVEKSLFEQIGKRFQVRRSAHRSAYQRAGGAYEAFRRTIRQKGLVILEHMQGTSLPGIVLVGRPYNLYDAGLNLNLPGKLRSMYGINVIPMDFLPAEDVNIADIHDHMFWNYGRRILQAVRWTREFPNLQVIYLSNFKCGPDSYIRHYVEDALGRPFLFLQLDSHSNDAGVMTRVEAFLESRGMI